MELRYYWSIIWRRIWIVALIVGIVTIYAGYQYYKIRTPDGGLKVYHSEITIRIGLQPTDNSTSSTTISDYATTSETLADEFTSDQVLKSPEFDTQVIQQIQTNLRQHPQHYSANADLGPWQDAKAIAGALTATRSHNLVNVAVDWSTPAGAKAIATAIGEVAVAHISSYLDYEVRNASSPVNNTGSPLASAQILSPASEPMVAPGPAANKPLLLLALIVVALILGIALAFLMEYLDDHIHGAQEAAQLLQLPIYGEVPRAPALARGKPRRSSVA